MLGCGDLPWYATYNSSIRLPFDNACNQTRQGWYVLLTCAQGRVWSDSGEAFRNVACSCRDDTSNQWPDTLGAECVGESKTCSILLRDSQNNLNCLLCYY